MQELPPGAVLDPEPQATPVAERINRALNGRLAGMGNAFVQAGERYGVDPEFVAAVSLHETAGGTFKGAPGFAAANNAAGVMDPEANWQRPKQFGSMEDSIDYTARNLRKNYLDKGLYSIEQIGSKYAPPGAANDPKALNGHWSQGVLSYLDKMNGNAPANPAAASNPDHIPTPPAYTKDGQRQQVWRRFDGVPEPVDPSSVNWTAVPVISHNQSAPPSVAVDSSELPPGAVLDLEPDPSELPPGAVLDPDPQGVIRNATNSFVGGVADSAAAIPQGMYSQAAKVVEGRFQFTTEEAARRQALFPQRAKYKRDVEISAEGGNDDPDATAGLNAVNSEILSIESAAEKRFVDNGGNDLRDEYQGIADKIGENREMMSKFYKVDKEFQKSFGGKLIGAAGQMVPQVVAATLPGIGLAALQSQAFQYSWDDAVETAARKGETFDPNKAYAYAFTNSLQQAILERVGIDSALGKLFKAGGGEKTLKEGLKRVATGFLGEGSTEAVQGGVSDQLASSMGIESRNPLDVGQRTEDFLLGGALGGPLAALHVAATPGTAPKDAATAPNLREASEGLSNTNVSVEVDPEAEADAFGGAEETGPTMPSEFAPPSETSAPPIVTPPDSETAPNSSEASVPFMITKQMESDLIDLGFTVDQIYTMKPQEAVDHLQKARIRFSKPVPGITLAEVGSDFVVDDAEPTLTDLNDAGDDLDGHAHTELLKMPEFVDAADGSRILLHNPERGSLPQRARHLITDRGDWNNSKVRWLPMVPATLQNAAVRLVDADSGNRIYVRAYRDGTKHMVIVKPDGSILSQKPFKGNLITQFPKGSQRQQSMKIDWVRPESGQLPPASNSQSPGGGAAHDSRGLPDERLNKSLASGPVNPAAATNRNLAESVARKFQRGMPKGPRIEVVTSSDELRGRYGEETLQSLANEKPEAFYDPESDVTVLIADNFSPQPGESIDHYVSRKILHESAGHGGLSRLFDGPLANEYGKIMVGLWKQLSPLNFGAEWGTKHGYQTLAQLANGYGYDLKTPEGIFRSVEEHLARLSEDPNPPSWFDQVVAQITKLLRSAGYNTWTEADTRVLLSKARQQVGMTPAQNSRARGIQFSKVIDEAATDPVKKRKFIESVQAAESVLPDVKSRIKGVYDPVSNAATIEQARQWVNERGIEKARADLLAVRAPEAFHYTAGIDLLNRLQRSGRFDDAAQLVESMAEKATDQGRAIQSLSLLSKLSPDGIQFYAQRVIKKAIEKSPVLEDLHGKIAVLREELRKAKHKLATAALIQAQRRGSGKSVQEWLNALLIQNKGSLWGRYREGAVGQLVSKMMGPSTPDRPAALEEFTRRLTRNLREQLPERQLAADKVDPTPEDEAAMIGEAIRNFDKYKEVWKAAQSEVQARYRDYPEALQSLDDYLGQILETPFSTDSVDRAIKQTLQGINLSMREVLTQSGSDKAKTKALLRDQIVSKAGVQAADAEMVAGAVFAAFERQQQVARDSLLKAMTATRAIQLPKSQLQKLIELNNAGALDDARFFAALAKHYGIPAWTPELSAKVQRFQREHELAKDPELKLAKAAQMFDAVHEMIPTDAWTKVRSVQNIALLLNPKTLIRNIGGNIAMFAVDVPADALSRWVIDPTVSIFTGKRTRSSLEIGARMSGLAQPVRDFWNGYSFSKNQGGATKANISEGVQNVLTLARLASRGKYDIGEVNKGNSRVFSSRAGKLLEDTLGMSLSVFDRAFHQAAFKGSLARQMTIANASGAVVVSPTPEMVQEAMVDAAKAVFQDENFASKALSQISKALNIASTLGKTDKYGIGAVILPFSQVPGSILMRGIEWTPINFIRSAYEVLRPVVTKEQFDQKNFVDAFSRASLGSVGIALGFWLFKLGIVTALGEEDDDLDAMMEASGLGKFRLNLSALKRSMLTANWWTAQAPQDGDVTVNYDWLQPSAMPIAMGAEVQHKRDQNRLNSLNGKSADPSGWTSDILAGGAAALQTLEAQPLLMGLSRFARDAGRQGVVTATAMSALDAPGMFVPTFVSQINQLIENTARETRAGSAWDQSVNRLMARIPGLADRFPAKYDVFGEAQLRYGYGGNSFFNVMANPAMFDRVKQSPALREMSKVYAATGDAAILPRKVPVKLAIAGQLVELTNEQISTYQRETGMLTVNLYTRLAASPQYAKLSVGAKAAVVEKLLTAAHNIAKVRVLKGNPNLIEEVKTQKTDKLRMQQQLLKTP